MNGGAKQCISTAIAILKDAPIVILDEATASVGPENEHYMQKAISSLTHGKTIIAQEGVYKKFIDIKQKA